MQQITPAGGRGYLLRCQNNKMLYQFDIKL